MTLGLHNCYDPKQWHDIMRITLARAAPVALAFDCDLATFGFPFAQVRPRGATRTLQLQSPQEVADFVAASTSIGVRGAPAAGDDEFSGGAALQELAATRRLHLQGFPHLLASAGPTRDGRLGTLGYPAALGRVLLTTPSPTLSKATLPIDVARALARGEDQLLVFGLGPRGLPPDLLEAAPAHLEATGKGISLETATALGVLPAVIATHLAHLEGRA